MYLDIYNMNGRLCAYDVFLILNADNITYAYVWVHFI